MTKEKENKENARKIELQEFPLVCAGGRRSVRVLHFVLCLILFATTNSNFFRLMWGVQLFMADFVF